MEGRAAEATITAVSYTGGSYLIDSDAGNNGAGYNRDTIPMSVTVNLTGTPFTEPMANFRVRFRLLGSDNVEVPLTAASVYSNVILWPTSFAAAHQFGGGQPLPSTVTFTGNPKPSTRLNSNLTYRIEAQVQRRPEGGGFFIFYSDLGNPALSAFRRFYHFNNTVSGDPARNVIARMQSSAGYSRRFAITSSPNQRSFLVNAPYDVRRYDDFEASQAADPEPVQLVWEVRLFREAGAVDVEIPLQSDPSFTTSLNLARFVNLTTRAPATAISSTTLHVRPSVQLDSRETYYVNVRISHRELPAPAAPVASNQTTTPTVRLLHFSGRLDFGLIQTQIDEIAGDPAAASSLEAGNPAPSVLCSPQVVLGRFPPPKSGHTFGTGAALPVRLMPDGRAIYNQPGGSVAVVPPVPLDKERENGVAFLRIGTTLSTAGANSNLGILPPSGMTVTNTLEGRIGVPLLALGNQSLGQTLLPIPATLVYSPPNPVFVAEETKPVQIQASSVTWIRASGRLDLATTGSATYMQAGEMAKLAAAPVPVAQKLKRSNERYFAAVTGLMNPAVSIQTSNPDPSARLTAQFSFGQGDFRTHFPHDARVIFSGGLLKVTQDAISSAVADSRLDGITGITVNYQQACVKDGCPSVPQLFSQFRLLPDDQRLRFSADGGLLAEGGFEQNLPAHDRSNLLEWGHIGNSPLRFAHALQSRFTRGAFHSTGHFLRSTGMAAAKVDLPSVLHNSGFRASDPTIAPERPAPVTSAGYRNGQADYAGINLRILGEPNPPAAKSIVAGEPTPVYPLKSRSKYYIRRSGVAGIHDALQTPGNFVLYGFSVAFANFSFGFQETQNVSSSTLGQIVVPYPSDFIQPFEKLLLTCLGDLKEAEIPDDATVQRLAYWDAQFDPYTFQIEKVNKCSPGGEAILAMVIQTNAHHIPTPLQGKVGWYHTGQIVPPSDPKFTVTSRFPLPAKMTIAGPGTETYPASTVTEAYFNSYSGLVAGPNEPPPGFIAFAVRIGVPYFEELHVQAHTFARDKQPPAGALPSRLHMMGGWKSSNKTFFTATDFDANHRAYPPDLPVTTYRNDGPDRLSAPPPVAADDDMGEFRVYARRGFLNEDKFFEYPIEFLSGPRVWTSSAPQTNDILVFNVGHQLDRLSPQHADITFGVSHAGLPSMSITKAAFSFVNEATADKPAAGGYLNIVKSVLGPQRALDLNEGLAGLGKVTGDRFDPFADRFIEHAVNHRIATTYTHLKKAYDDGNLASASGLITDFNNGVGGRMISAVLTSNLASVTGETVTLLDAIRGELADALGDAVKAMDALTAAGNESGLFDSANSHGITRNLVKKLVAEGSPEAGFIVGKLAGPLLDLKIAELTKRGAPTLDDTRTALLEVRARLVVLHDQVKNGQEFSLALRKIVQNANSEFVQVAEAAAAEMTAIVNTEPKKYFGQLPQSAFENRVRNRLRSRLMSRPVTPKLLGLMRQYLYDLDAETRTRVDSGFQVVNIIVRNVLVDVIEDVNPAYTKALGGLASSLGAANIDGYARVQGDTARTLRLDMKAKLDLMSEMKADFYLQIDCRQSNGDKACSWGAAGKYYTEVKLGANNIEAEWLGDMRLNVGIKFTLADNGGLLGMGGSIELAAGKAKFESFAITDFGATAMFGAEENYVGAKAKAEFNKKAIKVGFFFGRTCSIYPLKLVDSDVASILGSPPFTGGYVYGEMSYPLNEILGIPSSCFLSLTGTIGAGVWVFIEGPEFGGKLYMKIVGEVLCIAEIGGEMTLLGGKSGNDFVLAGKGRLWVELCLLFCFEGEAGVRVKCRNTDCDFDIDI